MFEVCNSLQMGGGNQMQLWNDDMKESGYGSGEDCSCSHNL